MGGKVYVVFRGHVPGVYDTWDECKINVNHFPKASFASFVSRSEAEQAFTMGDLEKWKAASKSEDKTDMWKYVPEITKDGPCLTVDAACSGNPGNMEFKGVLIPSKAVVFECGPFKNATNNIGEFLAIVLGMKWMYQRSLKMPIYSDSSCALGWIKGDGKCNTSIELSAELQELIDDAEKFMRTSVAAEYIKLLRKWNTKEWGEIPADFGRK